MIELGFLFWCINLGFMFAEQHLQQQGLTWIVCLSFPSCFDLCITSIANSSPDMLNWFLYQQTADLASVSQH